MRQLVFAFLIFFFLFSCKQKKEKSNEDSVHTTAVSQKHTTKDSIENTATKVLLALKGKNYQAFAAYFHPTEGVRFSPYGFVDPTHKKILAKDFLEAIAKNWTLTWGHYDGSEDAIQIKVKPYIEQYIYNADYLNADQKRYDDFIGKGNTINNLKESYPNLHFLEYYFAGKDEKYKGLDWNSLKLVFKNYENEYYLVAIIHDQWTI